MKFKNEGFTLVEILIVVIILGILAAIVIPQFTEASNDARKSALVSDLQTVRSQLQLYKVQHLECYPDSNDMATGVNQLTSRTNKAGEIGTDSTDFPLGPYLHKFPSNPYISGVGSDPDGVVKSAADPSTAETGAGWHWHTGTEAFSSQGRYSTM